MHKSFLRHTSVAVLSAALFTVGGLAHAASPSQTDSAAPSAKSAERSVSHQRKGDGARHGKHARGHANHRGHKHGHKMDPAMWLPGYGPVPQRVVDSLELNNEQRALLDKARESTKDMMPSRTSNSDKAAGPRTDADKDKTVSVDPRARVKERAAKQARFQEQRDDVTQKWLSVWDSLDSAQQEKISSHIAERVAKRGKDGRGDQHRRAKHNTSKQQDS